MIIIATACGEGNNSRDASNISDDSITNSKDVSNTRNGCGSRDASIVPATAGTSAKVWTPSKSGTSAKEGK